MYTFVVESQATYACYPQSHSSNATSEVVQLGGLLEVPLALLPMLSPNQGTYVCYILRLEYDAYLAWYEHTCKHPNHAHLVMGTTVSCNGT